MLTSLAESSLDSGKNIKKLQAYQSKVAELEKYYSTPEWKKDFDLDEQGAFPSTLKRGVLSEDGIYDALEINREIMEKLNEK